MIVFIPPPGAESNPQNDWATLSAESIPRKCPECSKDSIIGHARSPALHRYFVDGCSLELAVPLMKDPDRVPDVSTVRRWFRSLDSAERLDRLQQLRLDSPSPPTTSSSTEPNRPGTSFPFLRKMMSTVADGLGRGGVFAYDPWVLSWRTLAHFLRVLLPLRC